LTTPRSAQTATVAAGRIGPAHNTEAGYGFRRKTLLSVSFRANSDSNKSKELRKGSSMAGAYLGFMEERLTRRSLLGALGTFGAAVLAGCGSAMMETSPEDGGAGDSSGNEGGATGSG